MENLDIVSDESAASNPCAPAPNTCGTARPLAATLFSGRFQHEMRTK